MDDVDSKSLSQQRQRFRKRAREQIKASNTRYPWNTSVISQAIFVRM
jgi:hypothetical protein